MAVMAIVVLMALTATSPAAALTKLDFGNYHWTRLRHRDASIDFLKTRMIPGGLQWMDDQRSSDGIDFECLPVSTPGQEPGFVIRALSTIRAHSLRAASFAGDGGLHWPK